MIVQTPNFDRQGLIDFLEASAIQEHNPYAPGAACFYKPMIGEALLRLMKSFVEQAVACPLYPVSSFVRIHDHGTELQAHFDRRGLDWTLSIPVEMDKPWPIEVMEDWEWQPRFAAIGEGALVNGTVEPHRRQPYEGQRAAILTLSYSTDRGLREGYHTGRRSALHSHRAPAVSRPNPAALSRFRRNLHATGHDEPEKYPNHHPHQPTRMAAAARLAMALRPREESHGDDQPHGVAYRCRGRDDRRTSAHPIRTGRLVSVAC